MFSLGQRIREIRMKKGLTQVDLAESLCTPSMISQIESDRARPSYKILYAIAEKVELRLEELLSDTDLNIDVTCTVKIAQTLMARDKHAEALPLLLELLKLHRDRTSVVQIQLLVVECSIMTSHFDQAEAYLQDIRDSTKIRVDTHTLVQTLRYQGMISHCRRQHQLAISQWHNALDVLADDPHPDLFLQADILSRLGRAYSQTGHKQKAIALCTQAADLHRSVDGLHEIGQQYLQLCQHSHSQKLWDRTVEYAEQARGVFHGVNQLMLSLHIRLQQATLLSKTGQAVEAIPLLQNVIRQFHAYGKQVEAGLAWMELATVHMQLDQLHEAVTACKQASLLLCDSSPAQADLHRLHGQISKKAGNYEDALHQFQLAADCFIRLGEIGDWEEIQGQIAGVHADQEDHGRAYSILLAARVHIQQLLTTGGIVL